jgi:hypothetical protein
MKKCPFCAEEIQDAAIKCRYCGSMLNRPTEPAVQERGSRGAKFTRDDVFTREIPGTAPAQGPVLPTRIDPVAKIFGSVVVVMILGLACAIWFSQRSVSSPAATTPAVPTRTAPETFAKLEYERSVGHPDAARRLALELMNQHKGTPEAEKAAAQLAELDKAANAAAEGERVRAKVAEADAASRRKAIDEMVKLGLIKRMDLATGKIYVNGPLWEGFELDKKEQLVKVISNHRKAEEGVPQVTLYDSRTGKELASYGAFTGVRIKVD